MKKLLSVLLVALLAVGLIVSCEDKKEPKVYTVHFEMNGHGEAIADVTVTGGRPSAIPSAPEEEGWEFLGWYADEACLQSWSTEMIRSVRSNVTVYAKWHKLFTVAFDFNGGEGEMDDTVGGASFQLPGISEDVTAPADKVFGGWALKEDGDAIEKETIEIVGPTTLYAVWRNPMVFFDANGGKGTMSPASKTMGSSYSISNSSFFTYEDKVFAGWAYTPDGSKIEEEDASITITGDVTLYALWRAPKVTFNANGGTGEDIPEVIAENNSIQLPANDHFTAPDGKFFMGWSLSADSGVLPLSSTTAAIHKDSTVYPVWGTYITSTDELNEALGNGGYYRLQSNSSILGHDFTEVADGIAVTLDLNGSTIDANSEGRLFSVVSGGSLTLENGTIQKGAAENGAGIYSLGNLTLNNVVVKDCVATGSGGGIYEEGYKKKIILKGTTKIENCKATSGSALYLFNATAEMYDTASLVSNSKENGETIGSAVVLKTDSDKVAVLRMYDYSSISGFKAEKGGAVRQIGNYNQNLYMYDHSKISDCEATGHGGAVYAIYAVYMNDSATIENCKAGSYGGAIYTADKTYGFIKIQGETEEKCLIKDCDSTKGGAICHRGKWQLSIDGLKIEGCRSYTCDAEGTESYSDGGAIYIDGNVLDGYKVEIKNCEIVGKKNADGTLAKVAKYGGAIYNLCSKTVLSNTTIKDCLVETNGGAIWTKVNMTVNGCRVEGCQAAAGGGIYLINASTVNVSESSFVSCYAADDGGACYVDGGSTLNVKEGCFFSKDGANKSGGAIFLRNKDPKNTLTIVGTAARPITFENLTTEYSNSNAYGGAAVCIGNADATVGPYVSFNNCDATGNGGAILIYNKSNCTIGADVSFTKCDAKQYESTSYSGKGGAIWNYGSLTMNGGTISNCSAKIGGGIFLMEGKSATLSGPVSITNCHASSYAGGIAVHYWNSPATLTLNGAVAISGNTSGESRKASNLFLAKKDGSTVADEEVLIAALKLGSNFAKVEGKTIGISTDCEVTEGNPLGILTGTLPEGVDATFFSSDDPEIEVTKEDDTLKLYVPSAPMAGTV